MILYTTATAEAIFPGSPADCKVEPLPHGYAEVTGEGAERQVCRIFSTDPADYLNPRYQPGSRF